MPGCLFLFVAFQCLSLNAECSKQIPRKNQPLMNFYISQKTRMHILFTLLFMAFNSNHLCHHVLSSYSHILTKQRLIQKCMVTTLTDTARTYSDYSGPHGGVAA